MSSQWVDAAEAQRMGLAWKVCEPDDLLPAARRHAEILASQPISSLMAVKQTIVEPSRAEIAAATAREVAYFAELLGAAANTDALAELTQKRTSWHELPSRVGRDRRAARADCAPLDWELAYIGDHEADLAWLLFVDWACTEYEGVPRLARTPSREETIARYEQMSGRAVRNLRYNEVLAAVALGIPISRLETRLRNEGLLTGDLDLAGFCAERIRQLLG
jgi:hypothetical protein